jgi:hypothetical protein
MIIAAQRFKPDQNLEILSEKTEFNFDSIFSDRRKYVERRATVFDHVDRSNDLREHRKNRRQLSLVQTNEYWWLKRNYLTFESAIMETTSTGAID